ncbi:MAG: aspartate--tRNA ligase [Methylocystis sp.]|nr:aspartate--tRNA ligase [Methylocystis sp.]MCA3582139.1 aspartate--tRNA ligase [Methylocystis sp.]MCA3587881.1 aspartate--tRNA ligase [Methylocystis sp.]MCA3593360.1 aspartate--tRNA ligase [Methylocystis sp.]
MSSAAENLVSRYRSHTCAGLRANDIGAEARLAGWAHRIRDHGGVLFIDLRDHYGLTQIVVDPDSPAFRDAEKVRSEWCIGVSGKVRRRPGGTENPNLPTGEIEMFVTSLEVLGAAQELPLPVFGDQDYPEETRLKYRFLDLRRERLHNNIMLRGAVIDAIRSEMKGAGFFEFQTPILTSSSPEGARDFLVPSRLHPGKFYALPQAPQQYKQLIMMAGFDRYFQIAPCFRDEDPRADRFYGEFYQLDLEMSFVEQKNVLAIMEPIYRSVFEKFAGGKAVTSAFPHIPYAESIRKYGSDKPDLRNPIEMQDVSEHFRGSGFKIFARILEEAGNAIWAIPAPGGGSRAFCDRMNSWAQVEGQPGLGYIMFKANDLKEIAGQGPLANNIGQERVAAIAAQLGSKDGDAAFFVAGNPEKFYKFAGLARTRTGEELNLVDKERFAFAWIVDFPMYEYNEDEKKVDFSHNPFSMPQGGLEALQTQDPLTIKAFQYDLVCNGYELASGGIRNHRPEAMVKAFEIAGYSEQTVIDRFGGMYRAFQYGAPPHGGMAAGIDRIVMLLAGEQNLREIAMFPMNQQAVDLLMNAPVEASNKQLRELHIRTNLPEKG